MSEFEQGRMDREEFKRKYLDTHTEIQALSKLGNPNNIKHPSDLNAANVKNLKKPYEVRGFKIRAANLKHFMHDAIEVRADDILDKKQMPMKDLLKIAVSTMPKEVKIEATVNTFSSLWDTVDIDSEDGEIVE